MSAASRPPRLGRLLLRLRPLGDRRDEVTADLEDLFHRRRHARGSRYASWRYLVDAASLWRHQLPGGRTFPARSSLGVHDVAQDIVFALRLFRRQPASLLLAIAGLALAIGITTAMFSVVNAIAFRGVGVEDADSVVRVEWRSAPRQTTGTATVGNWSLDAFRLLDRATTTMRVVASARAGGPFRGPDTAEAGDYVDVAAVSGTYFPVLGGRAVLGRALGPGDDEPGAPRVVVASYAFWKTRLDADRSVLGRTIWLNEQPFTVVGVAARAFISPSGNPRVGLAPAMWTTLASAEDAAREATAARIGALGRQLAALEQRGNLDAADTETLRSLRDDVARTSRAWNPPVDVFGRLAPEATLPQAAANANAIAAGMLSGDGGAAPGSSTIVRLTPIPQSEDIAVIVAVLMTIVGLVVLLACANVTNLLLARGASRRHEIATRLAVGASRMRIVRQLLTESVLLGLAGGALGLVMAIVLAPTFARLLQLPALVDVAPDLSVYVFVTAVATLAGLVAGLAPARQSRRTDLAASMKVDRSGAASSGRLRGVLIGGQAAASVVLLVVAALLTRSILHVASFDLGFDPGRLMSVQLSSQVNTNWDAARLAAFREVVTARVKEVPGVANASIVSLVPFSGLTTGPLPNGRAVTRQETSADYFDTLAIKVTRGRTYTAGEVAESAPVAVISERLAREYWGADNPVGSSLERVWGRDDGPGEGARRGLTRRPPGTQVIGVVTDTANYLRHADAPTIYLPLGPDTVSSLIISTDRDAHDVARGVRTTLAAITGDVRTDVRFVADGLSKELAPPRDLAILAGFVGLSALALAAIGLFGTTAFTVEQRSREVSVRMALGATERSVVRLVLRQSLRPVVIGLACGLGVAWVSGSVLRSVLFGVDGRDPIAMGTAVCALLLAAITAAWLPARRAARISPAGMLRGN
jgi:putative ABC transport system permease protein